MKPERSAMILNGVVKSLAVWIEEAEAIEAAHPRAAVHLLASLRQAHQSLRQMIARDTDP